MAEKRTLDKLAPELQFQILCNVNTPDDFRALIQASPRLYHVYLLNRDTLLSAVARRQFHPAVLSDALFFAKIAQLEQPLSRDTVLELCSIYPSEPQKGTVIPIPLSVILFKLARNVKYFIEDYARNTLPLMEGHSQSPDIEVLPEYYPENPVSYSRLSYSEIGRLQRAFCRFEIYRYLFARCSPEFDHSVRECAIRPSLTPAEQASMFLAKFPDFQVTEIECIRDYLYRRLRGICSRLEDEAVDTIPPEIFRFDPLSDVEAAEWNSGVWLFTNNGKFYQTPHIEHLMSLGLGYIRQIFGSTGEEQRKLFIRNIDSAIITHISQRVFITRAFELLGFNPAGKDVPLLDETDPPFVYEANADAELDIPDAWQWAHPRAPPLKLASDFCIKGLRDWGYVFWDFDRLRESGILERDSEDVEKIDFDEYAAGRGPSVQERLLGPPVDSDHPESDVEGSWVTESDSEMAEDSQTSETQTSETEDREMSMEKLECDSLRDGSKLEHGVTEAACDIATEITDEKALK